jgi:SGNH hydrolase-like domain, acetyltransferase AlgX
MSRWRGLAANLALCLAAALVVLLACEGLARVYVWTATRRSDAIRNPFARYDPLYGWSKPPGASGYLVRPEYRVRLTINSKGLRGPEYDYAKPAGTRRVLLLGDSFTEGYTVDEPHSVRARLERALGAAGCARHEVVNAGTAAWGTDQEVLFYRHEGRRYAPDVVVLLFYYNDLYGDGFGDVGKPSFDLEGDDDRLVLRDSPVPAPRRPPESNAYRLLPWRGSFALRLLSLRTRARNPALHARLADWGLVEPLPEQTPDVPAELNPFGPRNPGEVAWLWRVNAALLRDLQSDVRARGAELVVFYVPARFEVDDEAWRATRALYGLGLKRWSRDKVFETLLSTCGRLGVPLVDPRGVLRRAEQSGRRTYFPLDGHWTADGHDLAAAAIAAHLRARGLDGCGAAAMP